MGEEVEERKVASTPCLPISLMYPSEVDICMYVGCMLCEYESVGVGAGVGCGACCYPLYMWKTYSEELLNWFIGYAISAFWQANVLKELKVYVLALEDIRGEI